MTLIGTRTHISPRGEGRGGEEGDQGGEGIERLAGGVRQIKVTGVDEVGRRGDGGAAKARRRREQCGRCAAGGVEWISRLGLGEERGWPVAVACPLYMKGGAECGLMMGQNGRWAGGGG